MLAAKIQEDLKQAQLQKDELKVGTLRLLLSELGYAQIKKQGELSDEDIVLLVQKEIKKRKEAVVGFRQGGREESALKEDQEAQVLSAYLPEQLSDDQLQKIIEETINDMGAGAIADMGKVIGAVLGKVKGQADGGRVSSLVRDKLKAHG